jgi:hypothetical protein
MANTTYADGVKLVLGELGIASNHWAHFGMVVGAKILELLETESESIRQMGNWNPFIQEMCYSIKLPLGALRKAGGFVTASGMYFLKRGQVEPSEELLLLTPFGFAFRILRELEALVAMTDSASPVTAMAFLKLMKASARVMLQDAACLLVEHPERGEHFFFKNLRVFQSDEFKVSFCFFSFRFFPFVLTFLFLLLIVVYLYIVEGVLGGDASCDQWQWRQRFGPFY